MADPAAEAAYQYALAHPEPVPDGYELVTDGSTQEGDMITRTNTGSFVEKVIRHLRPKKCIECGIYRADPPSKLCPGCEAYQEHTR